MKFAQALPLRRSLVCIAAMCVAAASAQTIEKMKLTDGSLTCAQLYAESLQMDQIMRTGSMSAALPAGSASNPYGINTQAIEAQAIAAGQKLAQDPQVMALSQQYAAKAQAGTLTPQEQQQYAMMMMQNPAVQQQMQAMTGNVLGQMQASGAVNQATAAAMAQGMAQASNPANMNQALANAQALGLYGGAAQNNTQAIMQANALSRQDLYTTQQLMLQSQDVKVRAAASDPQAVAQYAAMLRNPQLAVAAQRAAAAGVSPAVIQSQMGLVAAAQQAALAGNPNAQANAVGAAQANALGGLFGALAGNKAGVAGNQQAANLLGGLFGAAKNQAAAQQQVAAAPAGNPQLGTQAQARKEHLTSMFLSKGCKMSDVAR